MLTAPGLFPPLLFSKTNIRTLARIPGTLRPFTSSNCNARGKLTSSGTRRSRDLGHNKVSKISRIAQIVLRHTRSSLEAKKDLGEHHECRDNLVK
jgi:hypothetical protein